MTDMLNFLYCFLLVRDMLDCVVPLQGPGLLELVTIVISSQAGGSGSHPGILGFTLRMTVEAAIVLACAGSVFFTPGPAIIQVERIDNEGVMVCVTDSMFG